MVKKTYTEEQKRILLANKNVFKVSKRIITYTEEFKIEAVRQYKQKHLKPQEIFRQAGFDIETLGKKKPKDCLERWNKVYKEKGLKGFSKIKKERGRLKKPKSKIDKVKRLELEIEYLKAENSFLAKLRAKRMRN